MKRIFHLIKNNIVILLILYTGAFYLIVQAYLYRKEYYVLSPLERAVYLSVKNNIFNQGEFKSATELSFQCFYMNKAVPGNANIGGIVCVSVIDCNNPELISIFDFELSSDGNNPIYYFTEKDSSDLYRKKLAPQLKSQIHCKDFGDSFGLHPVDETR